MAYACLEYDWVCAWMELNAWKWILCLMWVTKGWCVSMSAFVTLYGHCLYLLYWKMV